jgi:hypothetical protein
MKLLLPVIILFYVVLTAAAITPPKPIVIDIQKAVKKKNVEIVNRDATFINEQGYRGIRLTKAFGEGVAWIKGLDFSNGVIEFDVRGEDVKQHSFVGIAFHGKDTATYDAIYLRPFQFKESDPVLRSRSLQYISLPEFTWRVLREKSPGKFESEIVPSPDPNAWIRMRVVVKDATVSVYVNNATEPSLVIEKVTPFHSGSIGFYVADTSGGDFANLSITKDN